MPLAYEERILYHACEASISYGNAVYHIAAGDASLKNQTNYGIINYTNLNFSNCLHSERRGEHCSSVR